VHYWLARLPWQVVVYPGHVAGSSCGKKIGDGTQTTIRHELRFNYAFQAITIQTMPELSIDELATRIASGDNPRRVLDVRDPVDMECGPYPRLLQPLGWQHRAGRVAAVLIQEDDPVAAICSSGYRSSLVASLLQGGGIQGVRVVPGGIAAWAEAGLPTHECDV
jgi:rhodanese-related sulfurtransferase